MDPVEDLLIPPNPNPKHRKSPRSQCPAARSTDSGSLAWPHARMRTIGNFSLDAIIGSSDTTTHLALCHASESKSRDAGLSLASVRAVAGRVRLELLARPRRGTGGAFGASERLAKGLLKGLQPGQRPCKKRAFFPPLARRRLWAQAGARGDRPLTGSAPEGLRLRRLMLLDDAFSTQDHRAQSKKPQVTRAHQGTA